MISNVEKSSYTKFALSGVATVVTFACAVGSLMSHPRGATGAELWQGSDGSDGMTTMVCKEFPRTDKQKLWKGGPTILDLGTFNIPPDHYVEFGNGKPRVKITTFDENSTRDRQFQGNEQVSVKLESEDGSQAVTGLSNDLQDYVPKAREESLVSSKLLRGSSGRKFGSLNVGVLHVTELPNLGLDVPGGLDPNSPNSVGVEEVCVEAKKNDHPTVTPTPEDQIGYYEVYLPFAAVAPEPKPCEGMIANVTFVRYEPEKGELVRRLAPVPLGPSPALNYSLGVVALNHDVSSDVSEKGIPRKYSVSIASGAPIPGNPGFPGYRWFSGVPRFHLMPVHDQGEWQGKVFFYDSERNRFWVQAGYSYFKHFFAEDNQGNLCEAALNMSTDDPPGASAKGATPAAVGGNGLSFIEIDDSNSTVIETLPLPHSGPKKP